MTTTQFGMHYYTPTTYTANVPGNPTVTITDVTDGPPGPSATPLATFTTNAYTVSFRGPSRTFTEDYIAGATKTLPCRNATLTFTTTAYVRVRAAPFNGVVDQALDTWLTQKLAENLTIATTPDVIAIAMEYIGGAAQYGPWEDDGSTEACDLIEDGTRQEGSDFNDFLHISWTYGPPDGTDQPEDNQQGCMDCSGYTRMVYGYRAGLPLTLTPNGTAIPRRAVQIYQSAPGVMIVDQVAADTQVLDFSRLLPGDLVLFGNDTTDVNAIDHVGIYLDRDAQDHYRFISSRKKANGPTFADTAGRSSLDGTNKLGNLLVDEKFYYPKSFRAARRL
jgi:cell wall-associated NlpC family hydrolase